MAASVAGARRTKVPFVAAVEVSDEGHPLRVALDPVTGFTKTALAAWTARRLRPDSDVYSDGLAAFATVKNTGQSRLFSCYPLATTSI